MYDTHARDIMANLDTYEPCIMILHKIYFLLFPQHISLRILTSHISPDSSSARVLQFMVHKTELHLRIQILLIIFSMISSRGIWYVSALDKHSVRIYDRITSVVTLGPNYFAPLSRRLDYHIMIIIYKPYYLLIHGGMSFIEHSIPFLCQSTQTSIFAQFAHVVMTFITYSVTSLYDYHYMISPASFLHPVVHMLAIIPDV